MRSILFSFILSLLAGLALAIPPACLIHGVNTQDDPANLSAVCGNGAKTVQQYLASNCGQFQDTAQKAFIATCSSAGTSVAAYTATAGSITSSAGGSATGTGASTKSTAGANIHYRDSMGAAGAAALALMGAVAAL